MRHLIALIKYEKGRIHDEAADHLSGTFITDLPDWFDVICLLDASVRCTTPHLAPALELINYYPIMYIVITCFSYFLGLIYRNIRNIKPF